MSNVLEFPKKYVRERQHYPSDLKHVYKTEEALQIALRQRNTTIALLRAQNAQLRTSLESLYKVSKTIVDLMKTYTESAS